jgi:hypothetical protein
MFLIFIGLNTLEDYTCLYLTVCLDQTETSVKLLSRSETIHDVILSSGFPFTVIYFLILFYGSKMQDESTTL